jgi:cell division protease FtsH
MNAETLGHAVKRTEFNVPGAASGTHFSGDHLNALCRSIARSRLREGRQDETLVADVERALTEWLDRQKLTDKEEFVVATHEAGHAICAIACGMPILRIALNDDVMGALGYVHHHDPSQRFVRTRKQMLDRICIALGAREAEGLLLGDYYDGTYSDLDTATTLARQMVEMFGMGGEEVGVCQYAGYTNNGELRRQPDLSPAQVEMLDRRVRDIVEEARQRAGKIVRERRAELETLRDMLLEKKVIETKTLESMFRKAEPAEPAKKSRAKDAGEGRKARAEGA